VIKEPHIASTIVNIIISIVFIIHDDLLWRNQSQQSCFAVIG